MSYCRWSSDNFKCDLYIYEGEHGYVIHVAGNKIVGEVPPLADINDVDAFQKSYAEQSKWMDTAQRVPIGLPHDGETFEEEDLERVIVKVQELKTLGYRVPDYVLETLQEELNDGK